MKLEMTSDDWGFTVVIVLLCLFVGFIAFNMGHEVGQNSYKKAINNGQGAELIKMVESEKLSRELKQTIESGR